MLLSCWPAAAQTDIDRAFQLMYNQDFAEARRLATQTIAARPNDPLPLAVRACALLFQELDRLQVLEAEFFASDKRIAAKKGQTPDPQIRSAFYQDLQAAKVLAEKQATAQPKDTNALFTLSLVAGLTTDYMSLVEKRQWKSLGYLKESNRYAERVIALDPQFVDCYLTTGLNEYLVGSIPYIFRWAVRFDQVQGDKAVALQRLQKVASSGRYFRPFAKILLAIVHLREKRPQQSVTLLQELVKEYPQNRLLQTELARLSKTTPPSTK